MSTVLKYHMNIRVVLLISMPLMNCVGTCLIPTLIAWSVG